MTPQQLAQIGVRIDKAREWEPFLNAAMTEFEINTPLRQAAFIAQVLHESGMLKWTSEIWGPTLAQRNYENRDDLGNTVPGDGLRFRGRGLLQTTGRANYLATGKALGADLIANPERLAEPELASRSAGWFWKTHGCNAFDRATSHGQQPKHIGSRQIRILPRDSYEAGREQPSGPTPRHLHLVRPM